MHVYIRSSDRMRSTKRPLRIWLSVFIGSASLVAQCRAPIPPRPASLYCSNAAPICVLDPNRISGHWIWGCPTQPQSSWVDLLPKAPPAESASDIALKAAQARQLRQETELLRQQTEALRRQNEIRNTSSEPYPIA